MNNINQKECINAKFSEGLGIFDNYYRYPEIDKQEKYNGMPTGKVVDKQGIQAHAGRDFFVREGKEFCFEIDECPYLNIAIKAEKDTKTCLLLMVNDKEPYQHKNRFVVIGKTLKGDPGIYDVIKRKDLLTIKDDGKWHDDYCFDLRKIRNKFRNAGSISGIEFYSLTGSGEHSFHFVDLICKSGTARSPIKSIAVSPTLVKADEKIAVTAIAEPGGRARFSIAQVPGAADVVIEENPDEPGTYSGYYVTEKGDDVENAAVTVEFTSRREEKFSRKAEQTVTIDTTPLKIIEYSIEGKVASGSRAGVGELRVEIVDKNVGGDVCLAKAETDSNGGYLVTFKLDALKQRGKQRLDLQARVFTDESFLGASDVRYNASNRETLNVLLMEEADADLPSEHETLTGALFTHFRGNLRDLKETDDRQDITYLANKTGWDARAVALAALADQFSARTADASGTPRIEPVFFYALFRAGLPANEDILYHADMRTLEAVWEKAVEQGVISKTRSAEIPELIQQFQTLSVQNLLRSPALSGISSLKDMLAVSFLDDAQQQHFAELYVTHRTDMPVFWDAVTNAFGEETANRLQLDGKLGFLTINNSPLMLELHKVAGENGLSDPLQLAQLGYHRAKEWSALLTPNISIPKEIPGDTPEAKRANYMEYLAAQVRLSYPTASVAEMIKNKYLQVKVPDQVHTFLTENQDKFEIGMQPVEQYIALNNLNVSEETITQVKRLQRVYQITPSDQAMIGMMKLEIDAAYHVVRFDKKSFIQNFAQDLGGEDSAAQTYDKSVQVHNTVLNLVVSYLIARTAPTIGAHSSARIMNTTPLAANASDVKAYSTLETLFNSMDYCSCDHCRSILSPAAYLVDLLIFLDQPSLGKNNPQTILLKRRPDIENIQLTCENTNTALPYIDVVNETLEYFIANNVQKLSLNGYLGHDITGVGSDDLLASPQFVMDSAYKILRDECFPTSLPFHQPLENLRRYFNKFRVPLPLAMERFRKSNDLDRNANPYGWRDILMEEIGLSRKEYDILTNSKAVPFWRIFGFSKGTTKNEVIATLSNAKQFTRRIEITYEDIVAILQTQFVNPNSDLIPKLERLHVPFSTLKAFKDGTKTDAEFDALLPPGIDTSPYGDNIKKWVKDNYARIMELITLTDTNPKANPDTCKFDNLEFRYAEPMTAVGDTSTRLGAVEFIRMLRFIRLWKKMEWTIEQTDAAICALYRKDTIPLGAGDIDNVAKLDAGFRTLLPRLGIVVRVMKALNLTPKRDLLSLLACWSPLGTHGDSALYRQMFLNPALLKQDAVFVDNGYGEFMQKWNVSYIHTQTTLEQTILTAAQGRIGYDNISERLSYNGILDAVTRDALKSVAGVNDTFQKAVDAIYTAQRLVSHAEALRSAFNLTGEEYSTIFKELGFNDSVSVSYTHPNATLEQVILDAAPDIGYDDGHKELRFVGFLSTTICNALKAVPGVTQEFKDAVDALYAQEKQAVPLTPLTLANIGAVFRRGWLARKLKISVRELMLLTSFTGLDPFTVPDPTNPAILRIIAFVQALKDRSLKSAVVLYLIWNQDLSGKSAPDPAQVTEFARTLRGDFASIEDQFAATEDPGGDIARARMTLVYGQEAADAFFALIDDNLKLDVDYTHPTSTLEAVITNTDSKITYDNFRHRLSYTGVLKAPQRDTLKNLFDITGKDAIDELFARSEDAKGSFFGRYPELKPLYDTYVADTINPPAKKRGELLVAFQPELSRRRKRQQALQRFSVAANTDMNSTQALLDPPAAPYPLHAANTLQPAMNDVLALETPGLAAQIFYRNTATNPVDLSVLAAANLDYTSGGSNSLPSNPTPGAAISGVWWGQVEAPEAGFYNFVIETDTMATVTLSLDGKARLLTHNGNVWRNNDPLELKAGTLYDIVLTVNNVKDTLRVKWETPKRARETINSRYLYPPSILLPFSDVYIRYMKAVSLAEGLDLTANELVRFATDPDYQIAGDGWLNALSVKGDPAAPTAVALFKRLIDLIDYSRIKAVISPGDKSLLTILQDPIAATAKADSLLFIRTRWDRTSLNDVLAHFGGNFASLAHFDQFRRVYDSFALIQTMGISAKALIQATTNEPIGDTVRDLQASLRARYAADDWRTIVQPINDEMRGMQRDALVAYILHQMRSNPDSAHIDTADKLFEYFLMDVQMESCMQTSRIRHALSSVQLFIERCLMDLEKNVSPKDINAAQWAWMKRYRVWEANRKVFLFPENWLEPELRDDKSPFFKEIESELLQSDITEDSATTAILNYLAKLEDVAKLEPCGIYHQEGDPEKRKGDVDHVIGRTAGAPHKYYYRRYENGYWTPWEQIKLDIEDTPVIPYIWNDRLLLFWLRILKQAPLTAPDTNGPIQTDPNSNNELTFDKLTLTHIKKDAKNSADQNLKVTVQAVLCWSEYYNGKWQAAKTSDIQEPAMIGRYALQGQAAFPRSELKLQVLEKDKTLWVILNMSSGFPLFGSLSAFHLYNTHSLPVIDQYVPLAPDTDVNYRELNISNKSFVIAYCNRIPDLGWSGQTTVPILCPVLTTPIPAKLTIDPDIPFIKNISDSPFFFEDSQNVFFVTTTEKITYIKNFEKYPFSGFEVNPLIKEGVQIPPLVIKDPRIFSKEKFWGDGRPIDINIGVRDPTPMQRFVTEDAYIHQGIGTIDSIKYGDQTIGPSGGICKFRPRI